MTIKKRSLALRGRKTSISLEDDFWSALNQIAGEQDRSIGDIVSELALNKVRNLSSAVRLYILSHALQAADARSKRQDTTA
jgi:predicted DNA-binding ribbon-helix-helix protein